MKRIVPISVAIVAALALAMFTMPAADAGNACARTKFKTKLVKEACKTDQKAAKKAMKKFLKAAKKASGEDLKCKSCHTKTKGDFPLTKNGLKEFKRLKKLVK
jgi:hypothetical protein